MALVQSKRCPVLPRHLINVQRVPFGLGEVDGRVWNLQTDRKERWLDQLSPVRCEVELVDGL